MTTVRPVADGRYKHEHLDPYPGAGRTGWSAWEPHPWLDVPAPVGFALVDAIGTPEQSLAEFFVVPAARLPAPASRAPVPSGGRC